MNDLKSMSKPRCFSCLILVVILLSSAATFGQDCSHGFSSFNLPNGYSNEGADPLNVHLIVPYMSFSCEGTITEIEFAASHINQPEQMGTVHFEVWRPASSSAGTTYLYSRIASTLYSTMLDGKITTAKANATMSVSSGDILGYFISNSATLNVLTTSRPDDFSVYRLKGGSSTSTIADVSNSYDSSSNYSPLVSVLFVTMTQSAVEGTTLTEHVVPSERNSLFSGVKVVHLTNKPPSMVSSTDTRKLDIVSSNLVSSSAAPGTDEVPGRLDPEPPDINDRVVIIVGAVLGAIALVVSTTVTVGCFAFLMHKRSCREKEYKAFAQFQHNKDHVDACMRRQGCEYTSPTLSLQLEEYDDPDAKMHPQPYCLPLVTITPPLTPSIQEVVMKQENSNIMVMGSCAKKKVYETVMPQEDSVHGVVFKSNGEVVLYDTITDSVQPVQGVYETIESQYHFVPTEVSRGHVYLANNSKDLEQELRDIYEGITRSEYEDIPYVPPGEKLNTLYDQLANKKCIEIPRKHLKKESVLGTGEFGDVFKGVWETPYGPQDVAMKMLKSGSEEKDKINFLKEAALMGQFRHPHVIRLLGTVTVDDPCVIVLEFLPRKDLESYLHHQKPKPGILPESSLPLQLLKFCCEIADGMKYLSNKGFIHRDLATRNVLLDKNLQCKIADFGLSKTLQSDSEYYIAKGGRVPVRWTAPEALLYKKYSTDSDVWSFGMVMYEIWSLGEKPFSNFAALHLVKKLQREVSYVQPPPPGCPRDMYRLMVYCWDRNHSNRPEFTAIFDVLRGPPDSLLLVPSDNLQQTKDPSKAGQLGMPLEFGEDLYQDLQHYYDTGTD